MKSQEIKIRNLPVSEIKPKSVRVKPVEILLALVALGVYFIFQRNLLTSTGMVLVLLGISCITNMAAGVLPQPITHQEVLEMGRRVRGKFAALLSDVIQKM